MKIPTKPGVYFDGEVDYSTPYKGSLDQGPGLYEIQDDGTLKFVESLPEENQLKWIKVPFSTGK